MKLMHVCLYMILASMRRSNVKGNIIVFRNHKESSTICIVLTIFRRRIKDCGQPERRELLYSRGPTQDVKGC